jgi:hypothetical protein
MALAERYFKKECAIPISKDDLRKLLPGEISAGEIDKKLRNKTA